MLWIYLWLASILPAIYFGREFIHNSYCGGCNTTFWHRLCRDYLLSRPGSETDIVRISIVQQLVKRYADMERKGGIIQVGELSTFSHPFWLIEQEGNYQAYEKHFLPPKKRFWIEIVASVLWPITVSLLILYVLLRLAYE